MNYLSLRPFVPSGADMEKSKALFVDLGFSISFDGGDYTGFTNGSCGFILQNYTNRAFAENFMLSVGIHDARLFYALLVEKKIAEKHGVRISEPFQQPYGLEVNIIDLAGVCWHFVEENR